MYVYLLFCIRLVFTWDSCPVDHTFNHCYIFCMIVKLINKHVDYLAYSVDYSVGSNFFKNMAHRLSIFSNPVLRVFSKYILAVMADKSDEKLQRMEGFTSRSDSDIDVVNLSFGQMGCFDYIHP